MEVWLPTSCLTAADDYSPAENRSRAVAPARDRNDDILGASGNLASALATGSHTGSSVGPRQQRAPLIPFDQRDRLRQRSPASNAGRGASPIMAAGDQLAESRLRQAALPAGQRSYDGLACGRVAASSKATAANSAPAGATRRGVLGSSAGRGTVARGIVPS